MKGKPIFKPGDMQTLADDRTGVVEKLFAEIVNHSTPDTNTLKKN